MYRLCTCWSEKENKDKERQRTIQNRTILYILLLYISYIITIATVFCFESSCSEPVLSWMTFASQKEIEWLSFG